jgi:hypothetical protein
VQMQPGYRSLLRLPKTGTDPNTRLEIRGCFNSSDCSPEPEDVEGKDSRWFPWPTKQTPTPCTAVSECPRPGRSPYVNGTSLVERKRYAVRTKPLARQTLRVVVWSGCSLRLLHSQSRMGMLPADAPYLECSQSSLVVHYFQWNIDSNSNNGPRLP